MCSPFLYLEGELIEQQAGLGPGKLCTGQVLSLTQHTGDGFKKYKKDWRGIRSTFQPHTTR